MPVFVTTSPLSLARLLWWYGEDELWPLALALTPEAVAGLADDFGRLYLDESEVRRHWPAAPRYAHLLLPVIGLLEGRMRPAARTRRRPERNMPEILRRDEEWAWTEPGVTEVSRLLHERLHEGG